jgi:hypothetical protein
MAEYQEGHRLQGSDGKMYVVQGGIPRSINAAPRQDPIIASDPFKKSAEVRASNADARAAEDQRLQREKFDWDRRKAMRDEAKETGKDEPAYSQSAIDAFNRAIESGKRLKKHPGFGAMVGSGFDPQSFFKIKPWSGEPIAGTSAADFKAELDAMRAQVFLPMVQSMKGMGALSNAEGQKLTDAIGALDPNMSEAAFLSSLDRIIGDLTTYRDRGTKAAPKTSAPSRPAAPKRMKFNPATGRIE